MFKYVQLNLARKAVLLEEFGKRISETADSVVADFAAAEERHTQEIIETTEEARKAKELEYLQEGWQEITAEDSILVSATDGLFGDPKHVFNTKLIRDGENRPGKGEAEVERVYADSELIPLGVTENGMGTFGVIRLWGIFRGCDAGGETISTRRLEFGESEAGRNFFDVFDFDGYDIFYTVGTTQLPTGLKDEPLGRDLHGRNIWGQRVTSKPGGDPDNVDQVLKFSTLNTIQQIQAAFTLRKLADRELPGEERDEYLAIISDLIKSAKTEQQDYKGALDKIILAASRAKTIPT